MHSTDAEIQAIINGCNQNSNSIQNWHRQLQRLLHVLQSKQRKATHDDEMNYADVLSILQLFIANLRHMKLERHILVNLYDCIVTMRYHTDSMLRGQLNVWDLILDIILSKYKFILMAEVPQIVTKTSRTLLEDSTDIQIRNLKQFDLEILIHRVNRRKITHVIQQIHRTNDMKELQTMGDIGEQISIADYLKHLQPREFDSDSRYFQFLPADSNQIRSFEDNDSETEEEEENDERGRNQTFYATGAIITSVIIISRSCQKSLFHSNKRYFFAEKYPL